MRNRAIFSRYCGKAKAAKGQKVGRKGRNTHRRTPEALHPAPPAPSGHDHRPKERATTEAPAILKIKIYLKFCPFWSPKFPRKHQAPPKIYSLLPPFAENSPRLSENLPRLEEERDSEQLDEMERPCYVESIRKGTPPPIWGATSAFSPHNFSHQKSRKKSPWSDWKKFRKKFVGKCFGERESPQSCRKGARGAKI